MTKLSVIQKIKFSVCDSFRSHLYLYLIYFLVVLLGVVVGFVLGLSAVSYGELSVENYLLNIIYEDAGILALFSSRLINFIILGVLSYITCKNWKFCFGLAGFVFFLVYKSFRCTIYLICTGGVGNILCGILFYAIFDLIYVLVFSILFVYIIIYSKNSCSHTNKKIFIIMIYFLIIVLIALLYSCCVSFIICALF